MSKIIPSQSSSYSSGSNGTKKLLSVIFVLGVVLFNAVVPVASFVTTKLSPNQKMVIGDSLDSPDGSKSFTLEKNRVVIYEKGVRELAYWTHNSADPNYFFMLQTYGHFCGKDSAGRQIMCFSTQYGGDQPMGAWEVSLGDNGILYGKDPSGVIRWNSLCKLEEPYLQSGKSMTDACFMSPDTRNFLWVTKEGHVVIYKGYTPSRSYNQMYRKNNVHLYLSATGSLSIRSLNPSAEQFIFDNRGGRVDNYRLSITNDARMRIDYSNGNLLTLI